MGMVKQEALDKSTGYIHDFISIEIWNDMKKGHKSGFFMLIQFAGEIIRSS